MSKLTWSWKLNGKSALKVSFKFLGKRVNINIGNSINNFFWDLKKNIHTKGVGKSLAVCISRKPEALLIKCL